MYNNISPINEEKQNIIKYIENKQNDKKIRFVGSLNIIIKQINKKIYYNKTNTFKFDDNKNIKLNIFFFWNLKN